MKVLVIALVVILVCEFGITAMKSHGIDYPRAFDFSGYIVAFIYTAILSLFIIQNS